MSLSPLFPVLSTGLNSRRLFRTSRRVPKWLSACAILCGSASTPLPGDQSCWAGPLFQDENGTSQPAKQGNAPTAGGLPGRYVAGARTTRLLPERIGELSADFARNVVVHPVVIRKLALRHPEGAEQDVPKRKCPGEIRVAALFQRGVMPAVEYRGGEHVSERPQRPVQVGVNERRVEGGERADPEHDVG